MSEHALPCIRCDMPLKNVSPNETINQPQEGTTFTSRGQYGSTVHDPPVGDCMLEVNICDDCLKKYAETHVLATTDRRPVTAWGARHRGPVIGYERLHREPVPWNPDVDYTETTYEVESLEDFDAVTARRDRYGHHQVVWPQGIGFARRVVADELANGNGGDAA